MAMSDAMLAMTFGQWMLAMALAGVCGFLIVVILVQRGRGGGLVGVFGGGGSGSAFGAKTGDVFTWITVALAGLFLMLAGIGNCWMRPAISIRPNPALTEGGTGEPASTAPGATAPVTPPVTPPAAPPTTGGAAPPPASGDAKPSGATPPDAGATPPSKPVESAPPANPAPAPSGDKPEGGAAPAGDQPKPQEPKAPGGQV